MGNSGEKRRKTGTGNVFEESVRSGFLPTSTMDTRLVSFLTLPLVSGRFRRSVDLWALLMSGRPITRDEGWRAGPLPDSEAWLELNPERLCHQAAPLPD